MEHNLLDVQHMTIVYDKTQVTVTDFNLSVKPGEMVAIVGESGSGKTTVIRAIMDLLPSSGAISQGDIYFDGTLVDKKTKIRQGYDIAFVFQHAGHMLDPVYTVGSQFIEYIRGYKKVSKKEAYGMAVEALAKVNLDETVMKSYPFELSGGMQQRVGVAMAITFNPKLIFADEPTSALDATTQVQIVELFREINKTYGTAMVFVTHNLGLAANLAHTCLVMNSGAVVETGPTHQVLYNPKDSYTKTLLDATVMED